MCGSDYTRCTCVSDVKRCTRAIWPGAHVLLDYQKWDQNTLSAIPICLTTIPHEHVFHVISFDFTFEGNYKKERLIQRFLFLFTVYDCPSIKTRLDWYISDTHWFGDLYLYVDSLGWRIDVRFVRDRKINTGWRATDGILSSTSNTEWRATLSRTLNTF